MSGKTTPSTPSSGNTVAVKSVRRVDSQELFQGTTKLDIVHQGANYRLQITRQNKLILTK